MAIEQPTVEPYPHGHRDNETRTTHPAFGQIAANRCSGGREYLYASDFAHGSTVRVTISRSAMNRTLSNDWPFAQEQLIEVELSESQWATFVSSLNAGPGVPCTLRTVMGKQMPELPPPVDRAGQFREEISGHAKKAVAELRSLAEEVQGMGLPKGKTAAIVSQIRQAMRHLDDSVPFIAGQFDEHAENTVEKAKAEIHGYITSAVARAGLKSLQSGESPLALE